MSTDPRYPIGKYNYTGLADDATRAQRIAIIAETPAKFRAALAGLTDAQLDTPYREGGWSLRMVAHHVPDSHLNAYIRFKWTLTEENPTIKPYNEQKWAELADSKTTPIETSLAILDHVHTRWMHVINSMSAADFARPLYHPENGEMTLDKLLCVYAWHGPHHTAHITELRKAKGW